MQAPTASNNYVKVPLTAWRRTCISRNPSDVRQSVDGILEIFNAFNRANYQSYVLDQSSPIYGTPVFSANISYAPRTMQLGFRVQF